jgi:hypothetical protein
VSKTGEEARQKEPKAKNQSGRTMHHHRNRLALSSRSKPFRQKEAAEPPQPVHDDSTDEPEGKVEAKTE